MRNRILCIGSVDYAHPVRAAFNIGGGMVDGTYAPNSGSPDELAKAAEAVELDEIGIAVLTGGEDVAPSQYGHRADGSTRPSKTRDIFEARLTSRLISKNIPILGICRGAQFLCVMAGGKLIQDVTNHTEMHRLKYVQDGKAVISDAVTSTHHQMQFPWTIADNNFQILAVADEARSDYYAFDGKQIKSAIASEEFTMEPEVVWYPGINGLAVQYHPETMRADSWGFRYCVDLINKYLRPLYDMRCDQ